MILSNAMEALADVLQRLEPNLRLEKQALMAAYTTLRLGGPAELMAHPENERQLETLLTQARKLEIPVTLMGHGSNLLVKDGGIRGLVIRICQNMREVEVEGRVLRAGAGLMMSALASAAAEHGLAGLAFASGIPGTVGGGVYMNAGAYGGEMSQVVTLVEGLDMDGIPFRYTGEEMAFTHRYSRLMDENKIVTRVTFSLQEGCREEILAEMAELNRRRAEKQPLTMPSAGSTFKRPQGGYASAMVDQCGLKGLSVGGAQVSEKHAGFLVNRGGTAVDFLALMAKVQQAVYDRFGVMLEPEVRIVGEDAAPRHV